MKQRDEVQGGNWRNRQFFVSDSEDGIKCLGMSNMQDMWQMEQGYVQKKKGEGRGEKKG